MLEIKNTKREMVLCFGFEWFYGLNKRLDTAEERL